MRRSSRVEALPASGIRKIFEQVAVLEKRGVKVIRFDVGRPDFDTPAFVVEAAKKALDEGCTKYTGNRGLDDLLRAISRKLQEENQAEYDPAREIIVTAGGSEAVAVAMMGILEPGSEVLIPEPAWPHYVNCARLAGAEPIVAPLKVEDGFIPRPEILEDYVTPATRLVVLNSPNNPTGAVYPFEVLEGILQLARSRGLYVLADEMYEHFIYDQAPPSFASLPRAKEHTILINGFSKAFGMTGWRLGYLAAPADLADHLNKVHQYLTVCAVSFAQKGAVEALVDPAAKDFLARIRATFKQRRDVLLEQVGEAPGLKYAHPAGGFYFFPALPEGGPRSEEAALLLLEKAGVAVVPGRVFGRAYDGYLRLSYGTSSLDDLREGLGRMIEVLYG